MASGQAVLVGAMTGAPDRDHHSSQTPLHSLWPLGSLNLRIVVAGVIEVQPARHAVQHLPGEASLRRRRTERRNESHLKSL